MTSIIDEVIGARNLYRKMIEAAEAQGFFDGFEYDEDNDMWVREWIVNDVIVL